MGRLRDNPSVGRLKLKRFTEIREESYGRGFTRTVPTLNALTMRCRNRLHGCNNKKEIRKARVDVRAKLETLPALEEERRELEHELDVLRRRHGLFF